MARYVVDVMPKPEILDPQGKAVLGALPRLGFQGVVDETRHELARITRMKEPGRAAGQVRSCLKQGPVERDWPF
mgnify:CR=1 FL=1